MNDKDKPQTDCEFEAWDRFFVAALDMYIPAHLAGVDGDAAVRCKYAGLVADAALLERRKRYG